MVFVGLVPAVVWEQAVGQAVGQTVFCNAVTAHSVVGASRFRAHTFGDVRALHSLFLYVFSAFGIVQTGFSIQSIVFWRQAVFKFNCRYRIRSSDGCLILKNFADCRQSVRRLLSDVPKVGGSQGHAV